MRRGSISWRRWGEGDRSVTRGFDATGNCVLDAEFHATDGPVVEGDGQARECDFDAETRRETQRSGARRQRRMVAFGSERPRFPERSRGKVKPWGRGGRGGPRVGGVIPGTAPYGRGSNWGP